MSWPRQPKQMRPALRSQARLMAASSRKSPTGRRNILRSSSRSMTSSPHEARMFDFFMSPWEFVVRAVVVFLFLLVML
jgi:hypothetical protein